MAPKNTPLPTPRLGRLLRRALSFVVASATLTSVVTHAAETAKRAFDFTQSVGIRMDLGGANYMNNWTAAKNALTALKIKSVRTGSQDLGWNEDKQSRIMQLSALGVKIDFLFGDALQTQTAMENAIEWAAASGAALAFEGPNEWSKHYYNDQNPNWVTEVFTFQQAFRNYLRNGDGVNPAPWPTGPILAPTVWKRDRWAFDQMGAANVDNYCSVGTLHYYHRNTIKPTDTNGILPDTSTPNAYDYVSVSKTMDQAIADQQSFKPGTWVTETGEQHGGGGEEGNAVTPIMAAKYIPRLLTEFFRRGVTRIFLFELLDQSPGNYGLLTNTGAQRPAYTSLKNLMTLLDNPTGGSFTPGSLNFSLNGATGISHLLLQKANGTFYLLLWKDVISTDTDQTQLVSVSWNFTSPTVKSYLPLNSTTPVTTWTNRTQVQANVRDHVLILEIAP
jgi:hypothetical protein